MDVAARLLRYSSIDAHALGFWSRRSTAKRPKRGIGLECVIRGTAPSNLPFQAPSSIYLAMNLRTGKALGLEVPPTLLARVDEVIE